MFPCPSCCFPNSEQARLCGHCGIYLKPIGDYVLTERIGSGGFADVYRAVNRYTGHSAAIKLLHQKLINDREIEQRFLREGEILRDLRSPNVVQIYDFGVLEDLGLYLVMEWLDGESLDVYVHNREKHCLPFTEVVPLFTQLLYGLSRIHEKQVVHRDLKPKNFMVVKEQGQPVLKILDFGIAWVPDGQDLTERGMFVGSTYFMAPEQFKAQKKLFGPSTDLYVAGQLLLWMLTGKHVFTANTLQALAVRHCCEPPPTLAQLRPDLPFCPELEALVARSLGKKPPERYPSALAFLDAFKAAIPAQLAYMEAAGLHQPVAPIRAMTGQPRPVFNGPQRHIAAPQTPPAASMSGQVVGLEQRMAGGKRPTTNFQMPAKIAAQRQGQPERPAAPTPRRGGAGGAGGPDGGVLLLERTVGQQGRTAPGATSSVPRIGMPQQRLSAPDPRLLLHVDAPLKHTPLHPLKALPSQTAQRDSSPGLPDHAPLPTFRRKTTSMQSIPPIPTSSRRRWWLWSTILLGASLVSLSLFYAL